MQTAGSKLPVTVTWGGTDMTRVHSLGALAFVMFVSACATKQDQSVDRGFDRGPLEKKVVWGIYVDPDGCDVWMADDGAEGYAVARLEPRTGARVCSGVLPNGYAAQHKRGSILSRDPI